jgi:hypothetical protein
MPQLKKPRIDWSSYPALEEDEFEEKELPTDVLPTNREVCRAYPLYKSISSLSEKIISQVDDGFGMTVTVSLSTVKRKVECALDLMKKCKRLNKSHCDLDKSLDIIDMKLVPDNRLFIVTDQLRGKDREGKITSYFTRQTNTEDEPESQESMPSFNSIASVASAIDSEFDPTQVQSSEEMAAPSFRNVPLRNAAEALDRCEKASDRQMSNVMNSLLMDAASGGVIGCETPPKIGRWKLAR